MTQISPFRATENNKIMIKLSISLQFLKIRKYKVKINHRLLLAKIPNFNFNEETASFVNYHVVF